jgi:predicted TIM-barrel fold metal-dependent hydrolase
MNQSGVQGAILVPPSFEGFRNDYALEAARLFPNRFAVMGRLSLHDLQSPKHLEGWLSQKGMLGVRLTFHRDKDRPWLTDGSTDWFWPKAQELNIPVMVHAPERLEKIAQLATQYPNLKIIIDHMGFARSNVDEHAMEGVKRILPLASHKNIFIKISALACYSTQPYPYANLHDPIFQVLSAFGADRCFWGTDITRMPSSASYQQAVHMILDFFEKIPSIEKELLMGKALMQCLNWKITE